MNYRTTTPQGVTEHLHLHDAIAKLHDLPFEAQLAVEASVRRYGNATIGKQSIRYIPIMEKPNHV